MAHWKIGRPGLWLMVFASSAHCHSSDVSSPQVCSTTDPCKTVAYVPGTSDCSVVPRADGTACDDSNICTQYDFCASGTCVGTEPLFCQERDACGLPGLCDATTGCAASASSPCVAHPQAVTLGGCPSSSYWAAVDLGSGQTVNLLIDSGSGSLAVASNLCSGCGVSPVYTAGASATDQHASADAQYVDNSGWTGEVYEDTVTIGAAPSVKMNLVAMRKQTSFFVPNVCVVDQTDPSGYQGIIGLGTTDLTAANTDAYMSKLAESDITGNLFSVQLCNTGGNIWFGGYDPNSTTADPNFTPMDTSTGFYTITINDLALGGSSLGFGADDFGPSVVDTGTTLWVLPTSVYNSLVNLLEGNVDFQNNFGSGFFSSQSCLPAANNLTLAQLDATLPAVTMTLPQAGTDGTFELSMTASQSYLLPSPSSDGTMYYCPGLASDMYTTLGDAALRAYVTIFATQAYQMGFAPQQGCP